MKTRSLLLALLISVTGVLNAETESGLIKPVVTNIPHSALFGLAFDQGGAVAVGMGGAILSSADDGQTWKPAAEVPTQLALLAVAKRGPHTVAVGQSGVIVVDNGGKWEAASSGGNSRLLTVDVNSSGLAFAGGQFGTLLKSSDGGRTWAPNAPDWASMASEEHFGTQEPMVYSVKVEESGQVTIAGEYGLILRSNDAGASWRVIRPIDPTGPTLHALHLAEPGKNSYAVGQSGTLLISADGGETWMKCDTGTELNFLGVAASPNGQVVLTGMRVMYRSTNGGATWEFVREGDTVTDWYQAAGTAPGSGKIYAVGHSGKVIQIGA